MSYATVEDLEQRWRKIVDDERPRVEALLWDAAVEIDAIAPRPAEMTDADWATRKVVSCRMVKRAIQQEDVGSGVEQLSQTAGPFGIQTRFANPTGDLYLTKADRRLLLGNSKQHAGSVPLRGR